MLVFFPAFASAAISQNLYYGMLANSQVKTLQQYLITKGLLSGQATGNFYGLTFAAVKKYQTSQHISATGTVGPLTRQAINADIALGTSGAPIAVAPSNTSLPASSSTATSTASVAVAPLSGTLDLVSSALYAGQTISAPQKKIKLAEFTLTNNTNEPVAINSLEVDISTNQDAYLSNEYVNNLYVTYANIPTSSLQTISYQNIFSAQADLAIGKSMEVMVYGDVNNAIPLGSSMIASLLVNGTSDISKTALSTNTDTVVAGQTMTFATAALQIQADSSTPAAQIAAVGQRMVAGTFGFTSSGDSYAISELKFIIPVTNATAFVADGVLSNATSGALLSAKPVAVNYDGANDVLDFFVNIPVALNTTTSVKLSYDLQKTITSLSTNQNAAPILAYVKATNSEASTLDGSASNYTDMHALWQGIALPAAGVTVNALYLFKSIPTFAAPVSGANSIAASNSRAALYQFSVTAAANADVALKQLTFTITIADPGEGTPHASQFALLQGGANAVSNVAIVNVINGNYVGLQGSGVIGLGTNTVVVTFANDQIISAGTTQSYTLEAALDHFVNSASVGADTIATSLISDSTQLSGGYYLEPVSKGVYYGLSPVQTMGLVPGYNVLWSDESATFPNLHSDFTNDWYNGFNVLALPLGTQTVTAK